jgi:hypothetical protein
MRVKIAANLPSLTILTALSRPIAIKVTFIGFSFLFYPLDLTLTFVKPIYTPMKEMPYVVCGHGGFVAHGYCVTLVDWKWISGNRLAPRQRFID